jgi:hypothetical protein
MTALTLSMRRFCQVAASILYIAGTEVSTGISHGLALRLCRHLHIPMLLAQQDDRGRSDERHEDHASATWTGGVRFDPHLIFGEEDLGPGGRVDFYRSTISTENSVWGPARCWRGTQEHENRKYGGMHGTHITFSSASAIPIPPLTQRVATPRRVFRFSISCNKVTVIRVPVQPMG